MELTYKPDFERVKKVWNHFWEGEIIGRPPVLAATRKPGHSSVDVSAARYLNAIRGEWETQLALVDRWLESTAFLGEQIPTFAPDFGPDQVAACFGSKLVFNPNSDMRTNWADAVVDSWDSFLPITLDPENETWKGLLAYAQRIAAHAAGRYLVSGIDFHTHADALAALRHNDRFCMDFYDSPELIERAMTESTNIFPGMYRALVDAGNMGGDRGTIGSHPFWCDGKFATIQCDFIALIGPEIFRRFIMPAIEFEASFLDRCSFHLDGPSALIHLDDILSIPGIDIIQWVSGAGAKAMDQWVDLFHRCQKAGKSVWIYGVNVDRMKALHTELEPDKVVYSISVSDESEFEDAVDWLEHNT